MLSDDFDLFNRDDCPGCHFPLMAYRHECVRWNGVVWHVWCALQEADRLLTIASVPLPTTARELS